MENLNQNENLPQEGTPEYDALMRETLGDSYFNERRASFLPRFFATIIDFVLIMVIQFGIFSYLYNENVMSMSFWSNIGMDKEAALLYQDRIMPITFGITLIYFLLELLMAVSPGKLIMNLRIANLDGNPATTMQLLIRVVFKSIGNILTFILFVAGMYVTPYTNIIGVISIAILIGYLFALSEKRQALQDVIAKTAVFKTQNLQQED